MMSYIIKKIIVMINTSYFTKDYVKFTDGKLSVFSILLFIFIFIPFSIFYF